jgi:hypothetical protein
MINQPITNQATAPLNLFQVTIDNRPAGHPTDPKSAYFWQRVLRGSFVVSQVKVRVGMKWGEN